MKKFLFLFMVIWLGANAASAVTFNVQVPEGTQKCYVCGAFNGWGAEGALQMSPVSANYFTLELNEVSDVSEGFKYLCGQSWDYVEKDAQGEEISNRTTIGNPDIVASWRSTPEYNIDTYEIVLNGIKRQIKVYLPEGYENSSEQYPVILYNTVQQRYNNAGSDSDCGDYFFGNNSWHAQTTMEALRGEGLKPYILVQVCSFLGENTPDTHTDYIGTGAASNYLNELQSVLIPSIKEKYRVDSAQKFTIVGADYGALFSLYAAMTQPEIFGTCVAMSPMLWINSDFFNSIAGSAEKGQKYYVSVGAKEPNWMQKDIETFADLLAGEAADVYFTLFPDAAHNDESWGRCFPLLLSALDKGNAPDINNDDEGFSQKEYAMYSARNESSWSTAYKGALTYTSDFYLSESTEPVEAFVFAQTLGSTYTSAYYWNIANGPDNTYGWLFTTPQTIGFNSNHKTTSWQRVAVLKDGSVRSLNAMYNAFTVYNGDGSKVTMSSIEEEFTSTATVFFKTADKSFTIHYGSVNSGGDMGACTAVYNVSENCTEAIVSFDFLLNKVQITETKTDNSSGNGDTGNEVPFKERTFTLYASDKESDLQYIGNFVYTDEYYKKGSDVPTAAFVYTHDVAASYKAKYYWNIANGASDEAGWLMPSCKDIGFSNSHNTVSWLNVAIYEDGSIDNIAVHSAGFTVQNGSNNKVTMTPLANHISTATVQFNTTDKTFTIHFGSVNTASDQGAVTPLLSVSPNCLEAIVTYDFNLNKVSVNETKFGSIDEQPSVVSMNTASSVSYAGKDIEISVITNKAATLSATSKFNNGSATTLNVVNQGGNQYKITLPQTKEGIYTVTVSLNDGKTTVSKAGEINIRVLAAVQNPENVKVYINPYADIDWQNINRYKANFHTHTAQSFDTEYSTSTVVDRYKNAGYKILALTDHDANSYPWSMFDLYDSNAEPRYPEQMGMLAIPGNELSKDRRNNWSESTGGEFNHHNDFFTGRHGQEFMSLRESYAYTEALGGLQIINHPGQYWRLDTEYSSGQKNSPGWHADNFKQYKSLVGLEVYNQGNRRADDRILWDQILTLTMPYRPVWGYSCDDTHTTEQYFRNYQYMLMDDLNVDNLKQAMINGATVFSYEYTGSGQAKAPNISDIKVDETNRTITINSEDADKIEWISGTHRTSGSASSTQSTVIGLGNTFDYSDFHGTYVRARLTNPYGETATQPIAFVSLSTTDVAEIVTSEKENALRVSHDKEARILTLDCTEPMIRVTICNASGQVVKYAEFDSLFNTTLGTQELSTGVYVAIVATDRTAYTAKVIL